MMIQSVRGMPDILPEQAGGWLFLEKTAAHIFSNFGLTQIRTPIVEETGLFARAVGDVTDIVEKEMYTFDDRSGESLTLRPEVTAGVVRAAIEHGLLHNQTQRLWYQGPAFRYERPQKGRYRQFHQIGVECFGFEDAAMDAELIEMTESLWRALNVRDAVTLELNTIGSPVARRAYRDALVSYFETHATQLDAESLSRLQRNPLRILDSKNPEIQELLNHAPSMDAYLTEADRQHFDRLCALLDAAGIRYVRNHRLVRGLDYYGRTVFEWTTDALGAQGTVCGGGRYDGLVEHLGGKSTPGVGFALGIERCVLLMETLDVIPKHVQAQADVYVMVQAAEAEIAARLMTTKLRQQLPDVRILMHIGGGSLKSQLKKADRSGARIGLIIGEQEFTNETVLIKPLRGGEQTTVARDEVSQVIQTMKDNAWIT
jgi:histidyl-tRNA synthetase